ncbi:MAG: DUF2520 domain-containing protein [Prevotella sp.]|uniref:Rossmann-like and DUF2520 domain-containing protein n=1 Tax=Prevotella sp. TaxID=59823 RepID=UPI002A335A49|nr:DUF2520 domain-containing protein [Prevotella sp.]MDD7319233.1 DUF2520 domain-containing protein [Prevotellaceae bacterium]MDY4020152.1 DUF2520 domain-containing protein [Prevotella sp.]
MSGDIERIVIVGASNLATNLGEALLRCGRRVEQVFSRTEASAKALADRLHCAWTTSFDDISTDADLYIVAVKDSVLAPVLQEVVKKTVGGIVAHTAGSVPMSVFGNSDARRGVFYPMQTFSKQKVVDFREISIFVEASDEKTCTDLENLARELTDNVYLLDSDKRRYLHLAAVFACNFANHCFALADEILRHNNISFDVMLPLIRETVGKLDVLSPRDAQTGPAVRKDTDIMRKHAELIDDRTTQDIYELMSKSIMRTDSLPADAHSPETHRSAAKRL